MSSHFIKWLNKREIPDGKIGEILSNLDQFHEYLRSRDIVLCEATDKTIVEWVKYQSSKSKKSYYNHFELLSYAIEYYKETDVEINFKLSNVYLIMKNKRFNNDLFRLHIDKLLEQFRNEDINYEYDYKYNQSNLGVNFIVNDKRVKVLYASYKEDYNAYRANIYQKLEENDYYLVLCLSNETLKKTLIIPNSMIKSFKISNSLVFNFDDRRVKEYQDKWEWLKIG